MYKNMELKKSVIRDKINSFLCAIYISVPLVERIITYYLNKPYILFYVLWFLVIAIIFTNKERLSINRVLLFGFSLILLNFIISIFFNSAYAIRYFRYFISYAVPAILLYSLKKINYDIIFKCLLVIYTIYMFFYTISYRASVLSSSDYGTMQMDLAYKFVPIILVGTICFKSFDKIYRVLSLVCIISSSYYMISDCSSRGPIISIVCFFFLFYIIKKPGWKKILITLIILIIVILIIINFYDILQIINDLFMKLGVQVPLIDKMLLWKNTSVSFDNGRWLIYKNGFEIFRESPIWGNGIGCYEKRYSFGMENGNYIHQYFLQILCEFGIIGFFGSILLFISEIKCIINNFTYTNKMNIYMGLFLFSMSMPQLMFSSSLWLNNYIWLLITWFFSQRKKLITSD